MNKREKLARVLSNCRCPINANSDYCAFEFERNKHILFAEVDAILAELRKPDIPTQAAGSGKLGEAPNPVSYYAARTCWQAMIDSINDDAAS